MIIFCFILLLSFIPVQGRSIHGSNVDGYNRVVQVSIEQVLPRGMDINSYTESIRNYWTSERMASAQPMNLLMVNSSSLNTKNHALPHMDDDSTLSRSSVPGVPPRFQKASPSVTGKVYGQMGHSHYVCSASVIVSDNRNTLLTAAHCVYDTGKGSWASNLIFVPEYSRGSRPRGTWVWRTAAAMNGWTGHGNLNYDVAVILVSDNGHGGHVQDYTGALGMTKNWGRRAWTDAYGYPMNIHNGEEMSTCSAECAPAALHDFHGSELWCGMGGGSSGGPWTQQNDYQTSVNSFGVSNRPHTMFGPNFGDDVWGLWEQFKN